MTHPYLTIEGLKATVGIRHLFGTRYVGSSKAVTRYLRLEKPRVVTMNQVHGDTVDLLTSHARRPVLGRGGQDAVITDQTDILLTVATADCVPILASAPHQRVIAAAHAGWRGTLKGIAAKLIEAMEIHFGCRPSDVWVGIGPSAGPCCYEVGPQVLNPLMDQFRDYEAVIHDRQNGKARLDLRRWNRIQLTEAGVPPGQIHALNLCTICNPEQFYSFRRDGRTGNKMISGIVLNER